MDYPLHRFAAMADLSEEDVASLRTLGGKRTVHGVKATIWREGDRTGGVHLLLDGWVLSSVLLRSGKRFVQKVHLPGDILGAPSMALKTAADTLTTVTPAVTAFVSEQEIGAMFADQPRLTSMFVMVAQLERVALMDMLAVVGQCQAHERMARFLLDLHARLSLVGAVDDDAFYCPLTQEVMGDLLGLTPVHVNRVVRRFEQQGLIARHDHRICLTDIPALRQLSPVLPRSIQHEPAWLPKGRE